MPFESCDYDSIRAFRFYGDVKRGFCKPLSTEAIKMVSDVERTLQTFEKNGRDDVSKAVLYIYCSKTGRSVKQLTSEYSEKHFYTERTVFRFLQDARDKYVTIKHDKNVVK